MLLQVTSDFPIMGTVSFPAQPKRPVERGPMITTHVLSILVLALALAFVLICSGFVYLQREIAKASERIDALEKRPVASANTNAATASAH